jgi:hypothetical protein
MSSAINTPLPLRRLEAAASKAPNLVSNKNIGAGEQKNFQQTEGSHNTQFKAETIHYHGEHSLWTRALAHRTTNGGARTNKDPASAILYRALPSRSRLCRPTITSRARGKAVDME